MDSKLRIEEGRLGLENDMNGLMNASSEVFVSMDTLPVDLNSSSHTIIASDLWSVRRIFCLFQKISLEFA